MSNQAVQSGLLLRKIIRITMLEGIGKEGFINLIKLLWDDEELKYLKEGFEEQKK